MIWHILTLMRVVRINEKRTLADKQTQTLLREGLLANYCSDHILVKAS